MKFKKIFVYLLVVAFVFTFTWTAMAEKPETLSIISSEHYNRLGYTGIQAFEEEYGIEVEWQILPYDDIFTQQTTAIAGGQPLDVIFMSNSWHAELGDMGMIYSVDDMIADGYIDESYLDNYMDATLNNMTSRDTLWGLPIQAGLVYFYYNENMLEELGYEKPPATWEELEEISQAAIDAELADHGLYLGLAPLEGLMVYYDIFLKLHDGEWLDEEAPEFTFNSDAGVEALEYMKHLIDTGISPRAGLQTPDRESMYSFMAGRAPFHLNWTFAWTQLSNPEESAAHDSVGISLIPGIERESYTTLGGGGFAVSSTTEYPEWSAKLLSYLTGEESAHNVIVQDATGAAWDAAYTDEVMKDPLPQATFEQIDFGGFRPSAYLTWYSEFRDNIFLPRLHDALLGNVDAREALDAAKAEAQEKLEEEGL